MPRYHFDIDGDASDPDRDGSELPDAQAAGVEAVRLAAGILKDDAARVAAGGLWRMAVTDEAGATVLRLSLAVTWGAGAVGA